MAIDVLKIQRNLAILHTAVRTVLHNARLGQYKGSRLGICHMIEVKIGGNCELLRTIRILWQGWRGFSGRLPFPILVKGMKFDNADQQYNFYSKWHGKQLSERIDLLEYLEQQLSERIDKIDVLLCLEGLVADYLNGLIRPNHPPLCNHLEQCRIPGVVIKKYFADWPEFSGSRTYPVGKGVRDFGELAFYTGEYGAARIRLAQFIINRIANEIENDSYYQLLGGVK